MAEVARGLGGGWSNSTNGATVESEWHDPGGKIRRCRGAASIASCQTPANARLTVHRTSMTASTEDFPDHRDVVVVGGGQSALAVGYYLRRTRLSWAILDDGRAPGGAWQHTWASLRLFSPAQWSSLPGRLMPGGTSYYPTRDEALTYLADYEARYALPIVRPVRVSRVERAGDRLRVITGAGAWIARAVVSATGTWSAPNVPRISGQDRFAGRIIHSARYESPTEFDGRRVVVVGGGNSGAQIVADLAGSTTVTWGASAETATRPTLRTRGWLRSDTAPSHRVGRSRAGAVAGDGSSWRCFRSGGSPWASMRNSRLTTRSSWE